MKILARVLLSAALLWALPSQAACTVGATALPFGNYSPLGALPKDAVGQVTVNCSFVVSVLTTYTVKLSTGASGQYSTRRLSSGGNTLNYNLYLDALRLLIWGNGTGGSSTVQHTQLIGIGGYTGTHPVYGRIPAQQNIAPGSYSDTITVTLDY